MGSQHININSTTNIQTKQCQQLTRHESRDGAM